MTDRFVVVGGSFAGLGASIALARTGATVTLVERDDLPAAADPDEAFALERQGTPQTHQGHTMMARLSVLLPERFPEQWAALQAVGVGPESLGGGIEFEEGVGMLFTRRTTVEWALQQAVRRDDRIELRCGRTVTGVVTGPPVDGIPAVTGAVLDDGTVVEGTVVVCTGRRGEVNTLLEPHGVCIPEEQADCDMMYVTRWYRGISGSVPRERRVRHLGFVYYFGLPGDANAFSMSFCFDPHDKELRSALLDDARFDRVVSRLPGIGPLVASGELLPLRSSQPMAGFVNRIRRFVDNGAPRVVGLHAVGDAHTCTNPVYGRGCTLALLQATLLADAVSAHEGDRHKQALAYEAACAREIEPWYENANFMDALQQQAAAGSPEASELTTLFYALAAGTVHDPVVTKLARVIGLLDLPDTALGDPAFLARVMEIGKVAAELAARDFTQPSRQEFLDIAHGRV